MRTCVISGLFAILFLLSARATVNNTLKFVPRDKQNLLQVVLALPEQVATNRAARIYVGL